jgi:hypothetical protein
MSGAQIGPAMLGAVSHIDEPTVEPERYGPVNAGGVTIVIFRV